MIYYDIDVVTPVEEHFHGWEAVVIAHDSDGRRFHGIGWGDTPWVAIAEAIESVGQARFCPQCGRPGRFVSATGGMGPTTQGRFTCERGHVAKIEILDSLYESPFLSNTCSCQDGTCSVCGDDVTWNESVRVQDYVARGANGAITLAHASCTGHEDPVAELDAWYSRNDQGWSAVESIDAELGRQDDLISDGFGNTWVNHCHECGGATMQVVRPGKVQCGECG